MTVLLQLLQIILILIAIIWATMTQQWESLTIAGAVAVTALAQIIQASIATTKLIALDTSSKEELESNQSQLSDLKTTLDSTLVFNKTELQQLSATLNQLQQDLLNKATLEDFSQTHHLITNFQNKFQEIDQTTQTLNKILDESQHNLNNFSQHTTHSLNDQTARISQLTQSIAKLEEIDNATNYQLQNVTMSLDETKKELLNKVNLSQLGQTNEQIAELSLTTQSHQDTINQLQTQIRDLSNHQTDQINQLNSTLERLEQTQADINKTQETLVQSEQNIKDQINSIANNLQHITQILETKVNQSALELVTQNIPTNLSQLPNRISALEQNLTNQDTKLSDLNNHIIQVTSSKVENEELEKSINNLQATITTKLDQLDQEIKVISLELNTKVSSDSALVNRISALEQNLTNQDTKLSDLNDHMIQVVASGKVATDELINNLQTAITTKLDQLDQSVQVINHQINTKESSDSALANQLSELEQNLTNQDTKLSQLNEHITKLTSTKVETEQLEQSINNLQQTITTKLDQQDQTIQIINQEINTKVSSEAVQSINHQLTNFQETLTNYQTNYEIQLNQITNSLNQTPTPNQPNLNELTIQIDQITSNLNQLKETLTQTEAQIMDRINQHNQTVQQLTNQIETLTSQPKLEEQIKEISIKLDNLSKTNPVQTPTKTEITPVKTEEPLKLKKPPQRKSR